MASKITWQAENLTINKINEEDHYLLDGRGVPYYKYPNSDFSATFEITGRVSWTGNRAWTKEKIDGLIPYLNQKLREYEDGFD